MTKKSQQAQPQKTNKKTLSKKTIKAFNSQLCEYINASPSPFHATQSLVNLLDKAGFTPLQESDDWNLNSGSAYYVVRNQSSIIAWVQGAQPLVESGWRLLGAHTDSPCLRVKPQPDLYQHSSWRLGVEVYGGALLNPWFDRDLSLAGRVHYRNATGISSVLVNFKTPLAIIPSLAIHLDREANKNRSINAQQHLPVLLAANNGEQGDYQALNDLLLAEIKNTDTSAETILEHELSFYDTQPASMIGVQQDFIAASRLDNLLSCFVDTQAFIANKNSGQWSLLLCSDHEEVGSASASGAAGPFLQQILRRIQPDAIEFARTVSRSMLISTDNAHALHPNHADKLDANHAPKINHGPVIKVNANQRYASNSETQAHFKNLCELNNIPLQSFVMRSDMACGSTIGPITAAEIGVKTLDVGVPTFAMHSIRELAGSQDPWFLYTALKAFLLRAE